MSAALRSPAARALRFVLLMGVVNLFADMTYEGARGEAGAFLASLGASGFAVGVVAGGGELLGYLVRSASGAFADRTGRYWVDAWAGYAINIVCVPALALAGSWPAAAALVVGERFGRGVRKPAVSAVISRAGEDIGRGWAFGVNEALDQTGATVGPLIVAFAIARGGGIRPGFAALAVPAVLTLLALVPATAAARGITPARSAASTPLFADVRAFRRYAAGGALVAAGFVDFALIAFRLQRDHVASPAAISVWFALAMAVGAVAPLGLGRLFDRFGTNVIACAIVVTASAAPLAFLGTGAVAATGAALWGLGGVVESLLLANISRVVARERRAGAFGVYDTFFGLAWFAGSALAGLLLERSVVALAIFSAALQLAAIPFFVQRRTRTDIAL